MKQEATRLADSEFVVAAAAMRGFITTMIWATPRARKSCSTDGDTTLLFATPFVGYMTSSAQALLSSTKLDTTLFTPIRQLNELLSIARNGGARRYNKSSVWDKQYRR
jgi:hypothetical protein